MSIKEKNTQVDDRHEKNDVTTASEEMHVQPNVTEKKKSWLKRMKRVGLFVLLLLLVLLAGVWIWSGSKGSLAQTIALAQRFVPIVGKSLQVEDVQGTLRNGGTVGLLHWRQNQVDVEVSSINIEWNLTDLWRKRASIEHVLADKVHVTLRPLCTPEVTVSERIDCVPVSDIDTARAEGMPATPENLSLPVSIDLNSLQVKSFVYEKEGQSFGIDNIEANYHYDHEKHQLQLLSLHFDQGDYQGNASLTARNPVVNVLLQGTLESEIPGGEQRAKISVSTSLQGELTNLMLKAQADMLLQQASTSQESQVKVQNNEAALPQPVPPSANLEAQFTLWESQIVPYAALSMQEFNLRALWSQAPQTLLSGGAKVTNIERGGDWGISALQFVADIKNMHTGAINQQLLPFSDIQIHSVLAENQVKFERFNVQAGKGSISGTGFFVLPEKGAVHPLPLTDIALQVKDINPKAIFSALEEDSINGHLNIHHNMGTLSYDLILKALESRKNVASDLKLLNVTLRGNIVDEKISVEDLSIKSTRSDLKASANFKLPASIWEALTAQGSQGIAELFQKGVADAHVNLQTPGIDTLLDVKQLHATGGGLTLDMKAPQVQQTLDWLGLFPWMPQVIDDFGIDGGFTLSANLQGGWENPVVNAKFETSELGVAQKKPFNASASGMQAGSMVQTSSATNSATETGDLLRIKNTLLTLTGRLSDAELILQTGAKFGQHVIELDTKVQGGLKDRLLGIRFDNLNIVLKRMSSKAQPHSELTPIFGATIQNPVEVVFDTSSAGLSIAPGLLELRFADKGEMASAVSWKKTTWQGGVLDSSGSIDSFPALWLLTFVGNLFEDMELGGDMMLGGKWQVYTGEQPRILVDLAHTGGELILEAKNSAFASSALPQRYEAQINAAYVKLHNEGRNLNLELLWDTVSAGVISVDLMTPLSRDDKGWTVRLDAPLSGTAIAQLPELSAASAFFPTGWRFGGAAILDTEVYGTVQAPELKGKLTALGVSLRSIIDGLSFTEGEVDIAFDSQEVRLNKFVLHGVGDNGGDMTAQGYFTLPEKGVLPVVELNVALNKLRASIHSDRELTVSGKLQMGFKERNLSLTGNLNVDRALIIIDHDGAPVLDDDVVVISGKYATTTVDKTEAPRRREIYGIIPLLNVKLNLGKDFRVQGYGLQTYLNGDLELSNSGWNPMLIGTIHTTRGRFKAYGQHLTVEKGNIVFSGNPMNPSLDVLAIRPQTQERVGVNIIGTAIHPKIRLYSESGLPESETLSWLILGRPTSSDGTEMAILQQAALALASGDGVSFTDKLAGTLGLDEISLGGSSSGNEDSISGTTVTIGKRLGEKFYISYEQGLNNAMGTFFIFYDISRRLTLRAQTGEDTALDLIYTFRFDGGKR